MCRDKSPLERAVDFHGHICPGLLIGVRAAALALTWLNVDPDEDENLVAVVYNDACGVDAIQAILSCTFGKGNLIHRDMGKNVYIIARRSDPRAVRIAQKPGVTDTLDGRRWREISRISQPSAAEEEERENLRMAMFEYIMGLSVEDLFNITEVSLELPAKASIHNSVICADCGELVMEPRAAVTERGPVCPECVGGKSNV